MPNLAGSDMRVQRISMGQPKQYMSIGFGEGLDPPAWKVQGLESEEQRSRSLGVPHGVPIDGGQGVPDPSDWCSARGTHVEGGGAARPSVPRFAWARTAAAVRTSAEPDRSIYLDCLYSCKVFLEGFEGFKPLL